VKLKIHGAAKEVGRSCIEISDEKHKLLLDVGIKLEEETSYPQGFENLADTSIIFLSHAHLDHSGCLPLLKNYGLHCPIITNAATKALTKILLKDSYKVEKLNRHHVNYHRNDIYETIGDMQNVNYNKDYYFGDVRYKYYDAGHIPGSSIILIEIRGKKVLYTGDFNSQETMLLSPANTDVEAGVDVMICESTYGNRDHPDRKVQIKDFIDEIKKTVNRGGRVVIPAFAVGRAQEVALMLHNNDFGVPVYLDGMAKSVAEQMLLKPRFIKNPAELRKALGKLHIVKGFREREKIVKQQGIFITTSGMLEGGPVLDYLQYLWEDLNSSILLTGYQAKHTNGRLLLDEGSIFLDGWKIKVKNHVKQFDFSAHAGRKQIHDFVLKVKPKLLVLAHGDPEACTAMKDWAESKGVKAIVPEFGQQIEL